MNNKVLFFGFSLFLISSCIKHEVVPPPNPKVELKGHFIGKIQNTTLELTENVNGYSFKDEQTKLLKPSPDSSSTKYFAKMISTKTTESIQIGLGSIKWNYSVSTVPTLEQFNAFHKTTLIPEYSADAEEGFEVIYTDAQNRKWISKENSTNSQNVIFSEDDLIQESDKNGDYSKFMSNFDCYVYHYDVLNSTLDSLHITEAKFKGWFKR